MLHLGGGPIAARQTTARLLPRARAPLGVLRPRVYGAVDASSQGRSVVAARAGAHPHGAIAPSRRRPGLGARAARVQRLGAAPDGTSAYGLPKADRLTIDVAGVQVCVAVRERVCDAACVCDCLFFFALGLL
jgi:hypothetical protein